MKSLIVIAVALASGFLVASGALADDECCVPGPQHQQVESRHQIDVMGLEYDKTPSLDAAAAGGANTPEIAPAAPRHGIDVMGREYNTEPGLDSAVSGVRGETGVMVPAASHHGDVMGPEYTDPDLWGIEELSPINSPPAPWW